MLTDFRDIRSIVFDLDGTLYSSPPLGAEIFQAGVGLVAEKRGLPLGQAEKLLAGSRRCLAEELDEEPTLSRTLATLGIDIADFHQRIGRSVRPERHLSQDPMLYALLDSLCDTCKLYLYTNNNLLLTQKILSLLGVEELFSRLFTIEYSWSPKPCLETLQRVMCEIGGAPETFLFIGDRYPVDLKPAESLGIATLLVTEISDLLQIHKMMGIIP